MEPCAEHEARVQKDLYLPWPFHSIQPRRHNEKAVYPDGFAKRLPATLRKKNGSSPEAASRSVLSGALRQFARKVLRKTGNRCLPQPSSQGRLDQAWFPPPLIQCKESRNVFQTYPFVNQAKSPLVSQEAFCFKGSRRRPTLPRSPPRSTIGAEELNFRVRNGNGCFLLAIATENCIKVKNTGSTFPAKGKENYGQASRPIRTG